MGFGCGVQTLRDQDTSGRC